LLAIAWQGRSYGRVRSCEKNLKIPIDFFFFRVKIACKLGEKLGVAMNAKALAGGVWNCEIGNGLEGCRVYSRFI